MSVATLAIETGQPIGHLLDLAGVSRCWPDALNAMFLIQRQRFDAAEAAAAKRRREAAVAEAKKRYG
jgi:hypothetical protein